MPSFETLLEAHLADAGISLSELARRVGCTHGLLSQVRSGQTRPPLRWLEALADALGLDGDARDRFIIAGHWPHMTSSMQALVERWQRHS